MHSALMLLYDFCFDCFDDYDAQKRSMVICKLWLCALGIFASSFDPALILCNYNALTYKTRISIRKEYESYLNIEYDQVNEVPLSKL
jgi:hypothetical protein